jgi:hypothetical protein
MLMVFVEILLASSKDQSREAFTLDIHNDKIKVISPKIIKQRVAVVIYNHTKTPITGRLEEKNGEIINFMSIPPHQKRSVEFEYVSKNDLLFFPLSPPFQEVVLAAGLSPYEIPEKYSK